jgi:hypothetical protein
LRPTLAFGAGLYLLSMLWLLHSPVWRLRQAPEPLVVPVVAPIAVERG